MKSDIYISEDKSRLDIAFIHSYLSEESYWAKGRSLDRVKRSIDQSMCFGLFSGEEQIGFARVVTDRVVFAWLMDLFVIPDYQGRGLGRRLVEHITNHRHLRGVSGIGLRTRDAHDLYARFGFGAIPEPQTWMLKQRNNANNTGN